MLSAFNARNFTCKKRAGRDDRRNKTLPISRGSASCGADIIQAEGARNTAPAGKMVRGTFSRADEAGAIGNDNGRLFRVEGRCL